MLDILEFAKQKDEPPFVLILDSLNDPQNFGSLLRTAEAVGVHGVILPLAHTVEVTPAAVNASSGASEHLRVARWNLSQAIDVLREAELWIVGMDQAGTEIEAGSRHLRGAIGLVTTHDLALTHIVEDPAVHALNVHFEDHLEDGKMTFDYRLHPGVVTKSNAIELMRAVGLEV